MSSLPSNLELQFVDDVSAFQAAATPFLLAREAENNLLLSLIAYMAGKHHESGPAQYWVLRQGNQVIGAALRTGNDRAVVCSAMPRAGARELAQDAFARVPALDLVTGPDEVAAAFAEYAGRRSEVKMHLGAYVCTRVVVPPRPAGGRLRFATDADLDLLVEWSWAFAAESFGNHSKNDERPLLRAKIDKAALYLWEDERGLPVSQTYTAAPTPNGIRVTGVYTPKPSRGRGYASTLVAAVTTELLSARRFVFLFTDLMNPTSNSIYQKVGYQPFGTMVHLRLL